MLNRMVVKLIKTIRDRAVPKGSRKFGISEKITQHTSIQSLPESPEISLSFIEFHFETITPRERQISGKTFTKCLFSHQIIENFTFSNCKFSDCSFNGAYLMGVEFHDCVFNECFFYKTKFKDTYVDPVCFHFTKKWHWISANINSGLFQSLYSNYKNMHQERFAMNADRKFQFYRRYQYLYGSNPSIYSFLMGLLFDYLLGHGYGIRNSLVVTAIAILGFAWLLHGKLNTAEENFFETLYFTIVSLTTAGYGEITPRHEVVPLAITMILLLSSIAWCALVTAIIVKRIVK
ncbi:ion channel [Pseudomonas putida]|uniref:ion channel n=1 Tax=Pseudomonas putida TaxID=303 RepID=UPI003FD13AAA